MKKLPIILVYALFLLAGVNTFANYETEKLATKMMNDPKVIQLLKNQAKLIIANSIKPQDQPLPNDLLNKINAVKKENISLTYAFKIKYPEFLDLSVSEQSEVLNKVLIAVSFNWTCFGIETAALAAAVGISIAGGVAQFKMCMAGILISDIIAELLSGGGATTVVATAAVPEASACATLAAGTVTSFSGSAIFTYLGALFACVEY